MSIETVKVDISYPNDNKLYQPIQYLLSLGGKRIRPLLAQLAYEMFSDQKMDLRPLTHTIELFHNFTLMHDDIMDKADLRRGETTVHKKWGEAQAILSGDAMLVLAYKELAKWKSDQLPALLDVFNTTALEVCEGQQYDMDFEQRNDVSVDEYLNMIRLKTAVLLGCSLKIGAIAAQASEENQQALYDFGINLGLAFQLKDDYLDTFGEMAKVGKTIGGDIIANKKTYLLIKCFENANKEQKQTLQKWINTSDNNEIKIEAVKTLYRNCEADQAVQQLINHYSELAEKAIGNFNIENEAQNTLIEITEILLKRQY